MPPRQIARLLGALCFEERIHIIEALIAAGSEGMSAQSLAESTDLRHSEVNINLEYMASTDMVKVRQTNVGQIFYVDLDLLENLFAFMVDNYGAGARQVIKPLEISTALAD
jgi:hypothetical protein